MNSMILRNFIAALLFLASFLNWTVAFSQIESFQDSEYIATLPQATELAESAGIYIGVVDYLNYIKKTKCSYAISYKIPSTDYAINYEIIPSFPENQRAEVGYFLGLFREKITNQSKAVFHSAYNHLIQRKTYDHKTACGYIASTALIAAKTSAQNFNEILNNR